uniref:Uncharacterized protein n=1 Tax=Tanacetum cinerariifolium TaxID=118510 RepID=A0A6L2L7V5_TANCI|nr:hypothetical protein [Tanacetum cinerariifolium]
MARHVQGNEIARMREEVQTCRNQTAQLNALIVEMEAFDEPGKVFDTLIGIMDDVRVKDAKLMGLNDLIAQAKEEIKMKETQLEVMSICAFSLADGVDVARGRDDSFIALMRDLCSSLRVSIVKNRRLIAELEALGQRAEALKPLDYMKEIVGRDAATLGVLEQLLAASHVTDSPGNFLNMNSLIVSASSFCGVRIALSFRNFSRMLVPVGSSSPSFIFAVWPAESSKDAIPVGIKTE